MKLWLYTIHARVVSFYRDDVTVDAPGQCSDVDDASCCTAVEFDRLSVPCADGSVHTVQLVVRCGCGACSVV